ncbi:hypothetical protein TSUD_275110 [Trifolium subterraneum]|uniref:HTH myb-type domain-containing protein n=1 Tax=Trifolium subterraneum TaxID=3900 RepID=A0A2Z6N7B6_TRISU|nr:hypothetical protein TSUD_275110 [Trifolium subterraneum]
MGRPPCCDKSNVKRGLWTPEEDAKILAYVAKHGIGNWTLVPKIAGLNRCGKSCRLRWTNYLRPDLKHDSFTTQEEELIITLHAAIGSRLSSPISLAQINSNFDWSEFLQNDDPFAWQEIQNIQQRDIQRVMSSLSISRGLMQNEGEISNNNNNNNFNGNGNDKQGGSSEGFENVTCVASKEYKVNKQCEGKSFSGNSFVDGILDKDSEIRAAFPELLDNSFDY